MAVGFDRFARSHTGSNVSEFQTGFSWTHTPFVTPQGILVFTIQTNDNVQQASGVTFGGVTIPAVPGGAAQDTAGEFARCTAWFLGDAAAIAGRSGDTVTVSRAANSAALVAVSITVTATGNTLVHTPGILLLEGDGNLAELSITDGSPGTNSMRFAALMYGAFFFGPGANSTTIVMEDLASGSYQVVRETTAGQGSRLVGFTDNGADDRAAVYLAVKEATPAGFTGFGIPIS
jgi:hypothetical protein